ncbi:cytidine deaminase [Streptomyces sp. NPDC001478]
MSRRTVPDPSVLCKEPVARLLVAAAFSVIKERYEEGRHQIAAAVLDADGRIYLGLHLEGMVGRASSCAENGALSSARMTTRAPLTAVAAVRYPKPSEAPVARIVPPCGVCRELLADHLTDGRAVIATAPDAAGLVPVDTLLPHKYVGTKWSAPSPIPDLGDNR